MKPSVFYKNYFAELIFCNFALDMKIAVGKNGFKYCKGVLWGSKGI